MRRYAVLAMFALCVMWPSVAGATYVSATKYDWSQLAAGIVEGKTTKYDQAYAIYRWLCDNIAYDTAYSIYTADEAYEQKKGVCQAYSELFYRLGEAVGLKVDIVTGKGKSSLDINDVEGHAWVFVYTSDASGILVDPTWGAGSVSNGTFRRKDHDDTWFDVSPEWMLFSHYPEDDVYQFMASPVSFGTWSSIPGLRPMHKDFGFDGAQLLAGCLRGENPDIPECFSPELRGVEVKSIPLSGTLRVGQKYRFVIAHPSGAEVMVRNNDDYDQTQNVKSGVSVTEFVPSESGLLNVSVRNPATGKYSVLLKYKVASETDADRRNLELIAPEKSPLLKGIGNYRPELFRKYGVDFGKLLAAVKNEGIRSFPEVYGSAKFSIVDIPWNGTLSVGRPVTFRIAPQEGRWAVVVGSTWLYDWSQAAPGEPWEMTVTPDAAGPVKICAKVDETENSWAVIMTYEAR